MKLKISPWYAVMIVLLIVFWHTYPYCWSGLTMFALAFAVLTAGECHIWRCARAGREGPDNSSNHHT